MPDLRSGVEPPVPGHTDPSTATGGWSIKPSQVVLVFLLLTAFSFRKRLVKGLRGMVNR